MELPSEQIQMLRIIHLCPGLNYRAYTESREVTTPLIQAGLVLNLLSGNADHVYGGQLSLSEKGLNFLRQRGLDRFGFEPDEAFAAALRRFEKARKAYNFHQLPTHEEING